jgi:hypothetical protein
MHHPPPVVRTAWLCLSRSGTPFAPHTTRWGRLLRGGALASANCMSPSPMLAQVSASSSWGGGRAMAGEQGQGGWMGPRQIGRIGRVEAERQISNHHPIPILPLVTSIVQLCMPTAGANQLLGMRIPAYAAPPVLSPAGTAAWRAQTAPAAAASRRAHHPLAPRSPLAPAGRLRHRRCHDCCWLCPGVRAAPPRSTARLRS